MRMMKHLFFVVAPLLSVPACDAFTPQVDKGFNLLETASKVFPQGRIVETAKETWKFAWKRMMAELAPQDKGGSYSRPTYDFGGKGYLEVSVEAGRYQLYVGNPCPWCHRARLAVSLLGIDEIGVTHLVDDPVKATRGGWVFRPSDPKYRDPLGSADLAQLYDTLSPNFKGRCTAPLLVDIKSRKIVSNESSEIVRMLNSLGGIHRNQTNLYPPELAEQIDETNDWLYTLLNNGVYRCGFSTTQSAYDAASTDVRRGLQRCQQLLSKQDYLCGSVFTESDLRLLPTVLRFDGAYAPLFRAGGAHLKIRDFPAILAWLQRCWDLEDNEGRKLVRESIELADASSSYFRQLFPLNAGGLVPTPITADEIGLKN